MWGVQCLLGPQGVQKLDLVTEALRGGRAPPHCQYAVKKERMKDKHPGPPASYSLRWRTQPPAPRSLELKLPPSSIRHWSLGPQTLSQDISYLESRLS